MSNIFDQVYKIKTTHLTQDDEIFNSVMRACSKVYVDGFDLILKRDENNKLVINLSDMFFYNHIKFSHLKNNKLIYYHAKTCEDIKFLIKSISWKNNNLVIGHPDYINKTLIVLKQKIYNNPHAMYFFEEDKETINICSYFFGLKYQYDNNNEYGRLFLLFKDTILLCNMDSIEYPFNNDIYTSLESILNIFKDVTDEK